MSDTREIITTQNANMPDFINGLAIAVNQTYSYANGSSIFCALVPAYMKDYAYRYIMPSCQWLDGYVPYWHDGTSGILSTRIAKSLITGVTKQLVGERLLFETADTDQADAKETLAFVTEWAKKQNIKRPVYAAIGWALANGTSIIKINKTADQKLWWEAVRIDNSYFLTDFKGEVKEATFFIRNYIDTRKDKGTVQYFLAEHRYYKEYPEAELKYYKETGVTEVVHKKGDRVPMVEYCVYRTNGTSQNNTMATVSMGDTVAWDNLPYDFKKLIRDNYAAIRIGEPQVLGLLNLGVEKLQNGDVDLAVPTAQFGESLLVPIESDMITYEYAYSCRIRDMYLGKGQVLLPKTVSMGNISGATSGTGALSRSEIDFALSSMPKSPIEMVSGLDPETQKPIVQQFDVRVDAWQKAIDDALKGIAVKWGMSPKILASYLSQGAAQQTATQIDSEDDMSIAFINLHRSYFVDAINRLIETTLNFYGKPINVTVKFASPSLINKDRLLERVGKELEMGLIDIEEAVRIMNPDLEEDAIQAKVDKAKETYEANQQQANADIDPFADLEEPEGMEPPAPESENLNGTGSTEIQPN